VAAFLVVFFAAFLGAAFFTTFFVAFFATAFLAGAAFFLLDFAMEVIFNLVGNKIFIKLHCFIETK
jgi:hypothetical protein